MPTKDLELKKARKCGIGRDKLFTLRLTQGEFDKLRADAKAANREVSDYARRKLAIDEAPVQTRYRVTCEVSNEDYDVLGETSAGAAKAFLDGYQTIDGDGEPVDAGLVFGSFVVKWPDGEERYEVIADGKGGVDSWRRIEQ